MCSGTVSSKSWCKLGVGLLLCGGSAEEDIGKTGIRGGEERREKEGKKRTR